MKFNFNLPKRVTKIKIVLTEENEGQVIQEKEYTIKREQLDIFDNEYKRAAYVNSIIGYDWRNPVSKRGKVAKEGVKRKEERHPWGAGEEFAQAIAEGAVVVGADLNHCEGGDVE